MEQVSNRMRLHRIPLRPYVCRRLYNTSMKCPLHLPFWWKTKLGLELSCHKTTSLCEPCMQRVKMALHVNQTRYKANKNVLDLASNPLILYLRIDTGIMGPAYLDSSCSLMDGKNHGSEVTH